jgi:SAM-dependent methyltransferase
MFATDALTATFYARYAQQIHRGVEALRSSMAPHFPAVFAPAGRVLDVGAGTGRDVLALLEMGYDAYGLEPVREMREAIVRRHARLQGRLQEGSLPELGTPFGFGQESWDGVLCSAVLMHIPPQHMQSAVSAMVNLLKPRGRVLLSLPQMQEDRLRENRDPDGRLFYNHSPVAMKLLMKRLGLDLHSEWESHAVWEQTGTVWTSQWYQRTGAPEA